MRRRIQAVGRIVDGPALENAVRAGADPIKEEAASKAPESVAREMMVEISRTGSNEVRADIGPSDVAWHAGFVELGTRNNAAKPFLRPAFDQERDRTIREIGRNLWASIRRAL